MAVDLSACAHFLSLNRSLFHSVLVAAPIASAIFFPFRTTLFLCLNRRFHVDDIWSGPIACHAVRLDHIHIVHVDLNSALNI